MSNTPSPPETSIGLGETLRQHRIRILFEDASVLFYASNIPFGVFYALVFCGLVPEVGITPIWVGATWFGIVLAQSLIGIAIGAAYKKDASALPPQVWLTILCGLWFSTAAVWGSVTWLFWQPDNDVNQAVLIILVVGAEVIIFFSIAASFPVLCSALIPLSLIAWAKFITASGTLAALIGTVTPLFTLLLLFFGYRTAERYREVFELQQANADLAKNFQLEKNRAEAGSQAKSEFLATMSHEIRTPMNGVLGFASLLSNSNLDKTQKDYVGSIKDSADRLLSIINDILDISKIEAGALTLDEETFSLRSVIESVLTLQRPKAHAKNLDLAMHIDPALSKKFVGDSGRLRQILMNFVGNAVKFTEKGSIAVIAKPGRQTQADDGLTSIVMEIIDTGIGIPADKIDSLFERFTQVDGSRTRRFGGTGLGLAICKELTTAMGGTVDVESEIGMGSTFRVTIALGVASGSEDRPAYDDKIDLTGRKILVVDDIALNRRIFQLMLSGCGLDIVTIEDPDVAIETCDAAITAGKPFDAVIIDHMMPNLDGVDLAQRFKASTKYEGLPLILSSSSDLISDTDATRFGFVARAAKPIRENEIVDALKIALSSNGEVTADVSTGAGSVLDGEGDVKPDSVLAADDAKSARILLVEDNPVNQQLVLAALSMSPVTIDIAHDGIEAVAAVKAFPYDLVLMDIQMPNMNGIEATARIRSLGGEVGKIPIIAMTADAMAGDKERYLSKGMDDYIAKPIDLAEMLAKIYEYLELSDKSDAASDPSAQVELAKRAAS